MGLVSEYRSARHQEEIARLRRALVHGKTEVNSTIVWQAASQAVPGLIPILEALLAEVAPPD